MKYIVGLTGGIGCGKSTIAKIFSLNYFEIFNSDNEAKKLYSEKKVIEKVVEIFGDKVIENEKINLKQLGIIAFEKTELLEKLNKLIHPLVKQKFQDFLSQSTSKLILKESALLFESGFYKDNHLNILVVAPEELRIKRVLLRDGLNIEEVKLRISKQWKDDNKLKLADMVIINDDNHSLIEQVNKIVVKIKEENNIRI